MGAAVRRAGLDDLAALTRLREDWVAEQAGDAVEDTGFAGVFAEWFEREREQRLTWLAEIDGAAVGMLNLMVFTRMPKPGRPASRWGYVANAYVDAAHRNGGVGAMLLDAAVDHAREHDFVRLVLSPSGRSVPFYERAGFGPATNLMVHPLR